MNQVTIQIIQGFIDLIAAFTAAGIIKLLGEVSNIKSNLAALSTDMEWVKSGAKAIGDRAGHAVHSPHTPEFDMLIEEFWHGSLNEQSARELARRLDMIVHEKPDAPICPGHAYSDSQKAAAREMIFAISVLFKTPPTSTIEEKKKNNRI